MPVKGKSNLVDAVSQATVSVSHKICNVSSEYRAVLTEGMLDPFPNEVG